jgi:microcystin degradation protein MlrC
MLIDHGDNYGSGGNQDVMAVVPEKDLENVCAGPISGRETVAKLIDAGVDVEVTVDLGGKVDMPAMSLKGVSLKVTGTVRLITVGSFIVTGPMFTGVRIEYWTIGCSRHR